MSWTDPNIASVMKVEVMTTSNGGHPPEFWAKRAAERIVQISESAHPAIRDQAMAFRNDLEQVILTHIRLALQSDRTTVNYHLTQAGHPELADLLRSL